MLPPPYPATPLDAAVLHLAVYVEHHPTIVAVLSTPDGSEPGETDWKHVIAVVCAGTPVINDVSVTVVHRLVVERQRVLAQGV